MFVEERGRVEYSTAEISECAEPDCTCTRRYGVEAHEVEEEVLFGLITIGEEERTKQYCPKHSSDAELSEKARRKEHEQARKRWREMKEVHQSEEFREVVASNILPTFRYQGDAIHGPEKRRFTAETESFSEAKEFLLYRIKENTCGFTRRMNPTTLSQSTLQ